MLFWLNQRITSSRFANKNPLNPIGCGFEVYQIHLMYSSKKVLIHLGILVLEALHLHRETSVLHAQRKENDAKEEHPKVVFIVGNMEDNTEN